MPQIGLVAVAAETWAVESIPQRQEMALEIGVSRVLPPGRDSLRAIRKNTAPGIDLALECASVPDALNMALKSVRPRGRVVVASIQQHPVEVEFNRVAIKEIQIRGSFGFINELDAALELISQNPGDYQSLITAVVSLEEAPAAFNELIRERKGLKTVIQIN